eukprot:2501865-Pyramimonas_sp.AAC.1
MVIPHKRGAFGADCETLAFYQQAAERLRNARRKPHTAHERSKEAEAGLETTQESINTVKHNMNMTSSGVGETKVHIFNARNYERTSAKARKSM